MRSVKNEWMRLCSPMVNVTHMTHIHAQSIPVCPAHLVQYRS